jgi:hypothetical protein
MDKPGSWATFRGRARELEEFLKPGEGWREAVEDVRRLWRSCGFVVEVYCPGRRRAGGDPGADIVTPTRSES